MWFWDVLTGAVGAEMIRGVGESRDIGSRVRVVCDLEQVNRAGLGAGIAMPPQTRGREARRLELELDIGVTGLPSRIEMALDALETCDTVPVRPPIWRLEFLEFGAAAPWVAGVQ